MYEWFAQQSPILQALLAGLFTWFITAAGAAVVVFTKKFPDILLDGMLGFAAGVMIAASFWSLLAPSIEIAEASGHIAWMPAVIGFLLGGISIRIADHFLPHIHPGHPTHEQEGLPTTWQRTTLLVLAITLHNIPEGLAVGVAYGAVAMGEEFALGTSLSGAIALSIGIGIQNFPEGIAVAMPLRREGISKRKCFWYGQLSAIVEPISGVLGAWLVITIEPVLPYALSFAAGAMIYVVVEELIPTSQGKGRTDLATFLTLIGFAVMMLLDVALG